MTNLRQVSQAHFLGTRIARTLKEDAMGTDMHTFIDCGEGTDPIEIYCSHRSSVLFTLLGLKGQEPGRGTFDPQKRLQWRDAKASWDEVLQDVQNDDSLAAWSGCDRDRFERLLRDGWVFQYLDHTVTELSLRARALWEVKKKKAGLDLLYARAAQLSQLREIQSLFTLATGHEHSGGEYVDPTTSFGLKEIIRCMTSLEQEGLNPTLVYWFS